MKRLPKGTLKPLAKETGLRADYLSALVTGKKRPSRKLAQTLEKASSVIGKHIPAATWLLGSKGEIREALLFGRA